MPEDDLTLYAKWIPRPNEYTVRHYYEGLDTKYTLEETTLQNNVKTDDLLGEEKVIADNAIPKTGFQAAFIRGDESVAPDGSSVVEIYYKRQIHSVTCSLGELEDEDNPATVVRYRYGEKIIMPSCFMYGYTFQSWDKEPAGTMGSRSDIHSTMEGKFKHTVLPGILYQGTDNRKVCYDGWCKWKNL